MARRMVSETTIKNKQGEVIINNAMTVAKNGDVVVGKNLEVDGTLTVGGEPITPGGGFSLYLHRGSASYNDGKDYIEWTIINDQSQPIDGDNISYLDNLFKAQIFVQEDEGENNGTYYLADQFTVSNNEGISILNGFKLNLGSISLIDGLIYLTFGEINTLEDDVTAL